MRNCRRLPGLGNFARYRSRILSPDETGVTGLDLSGWVQKPLDERALAGVIDRAFRQETRKPKLMLVEDDLDLASVIIASFDRYGIQTVHARNGMEAIEMAGRIEPDLMILDLALPDVDGYGVIDWLKDHEVWRGLPLVVYSAPSRLLLSASACGSDTRNSSPRAALRRKSSKDGSLRSSTHSRRSRGA